MVGMPLRGLEKAGHVIKQIFFLILVLSSGSAQACTCAYLPLETSTVRQAEHIFIFRLISAKVGADSIGSARHDDIIGHIQVVSQIRGASKQVREISFSTERCCGARLDVGGYFVAFLPSLGKRVEVNNGNIVQLGPTSTHRDTEAQIRTVLAGAKNFEDVFSRRDTDRTEQEPVLAPCINRRAVESR